jgi:hypothetical protein
MRAQVDIVREAGFSLEDAMLAFSVTYSYIVGRLHTVDEIRRTHLRLEPRLGIEKVESLRGPDYLGFGVRASVAGVKAELQARARPRKVSRRS